MSAAANRRWVCPLCGRGALAPGRPRRDDTRRYCLRCSESTGRLVERTCPALERERATQKTKRVARTVRAKERSSSAEQTRRTAGPYDLLAEARRFARLPCLRERIRPFPEITLRRSPTKVWSSGHCHYARGGPARIVVTAGSSPHDTVATVLHEMVHAACGSEGHSARFWSTVERAAREAWPNATFDFANARHGWQTQVAIANGLEAASRST